MMIHASEADWLTGLLGYGDEDPAVRVRSVSSEATGRGLDASTRRYLDALERALADEASSEST